MRTQIRARGFTLIELMFVVVIIGIITTIAVPNYIRFTKKAKEAVVVGNMHTVQLGIESFAVTQLGQYPQPADEAVLKTELPNGRYPTNPFTRAETLVAWNVDPGAPGEISISNLPGGGYRVRGQGTTALLKDIVAGN